MIAVGPLRAGIKNGTLDSILFPEDPIRDAQQIISDLRLVFPPKEKQFIFGPMGIIGWGGSGDKTIITAEIGFMIELPSPVRIVLVGQIGMALPSQEDEKVRIHADVLGVIDFERRLFSIDVSIYDSRILAFALSGDMAMRLKWGSNPNFAMAIGGLHPAFQPPPRFPTLRRLRVSLGRGDNPRMNLDMYLAITSNSVQFGAQLYLYVKAGATFEGQLGFDALFIFSPFSFVISIRASLRIKVRGRTLASIGVAFKLSGPTPWRAKGKAKIKIAFIKITVRFNIKIGREGGRELPPLDPSPLLLQALSNPESWQGVLRENSAMVTSLRLIEKFPMEGGKHAYSS